MRWWLFFTQICLSLLLWNTSASALEKNCSEEPRLKSVASGTATAINFINNSSQPIKAHWIDYQGRRKLYSEIPAGQSFSVNTYVFHPWVVTTPGGDCLQIFMPESTPIQASVTETNPPTLAQEKNVLFVAQRLNKVENPAEIDRWWTSVINTDEGKLVADLVATYFGYPGGGTAAIEGIDAIVGPGRNAGNEHWGTIQAPVGYSVCTAFVKDASLNCNGTFTGALHEATRASNNIDGLHWYMVVPRPGIGQGRCWVDGTVVVTFVLASKKSQFQCQAMNGGIAFHYGK